MAVWWAAKLPRESGETCVLIAQASHPALPVPVRPGKCLAPAGRNTPVA